MKQVIVMRTDLNMRKGKMVAQGAHASVGIVMKYVTDPSKNKSYPNKNFTAHWQEWTMTGTTKICVGIGSEAALIELAGQAFDNGLPFYVVIDAGRTEFDGVPTATCIAIGPAPDEEINKLTGELKLL